MCTEICYEEVVDICINLVSPDKMAEIAREVLKRSDPDFPKKYSSTSVAGKARRKFDSIGTTMLGKVQRRVTSVSGNTPKTNQYVEPSTVKFRRALESLQPVENPPKKAEEPFNLDDLNQYIDSENQKRRDERAAFRECEDKVTQVLEELVSITDMTEFFRRPPFKWVGPQATEPRIIIRSSTFKSGSVVFKHNVLIDEEGVVATHPDLVRGPDGKSLIRSKKFEVGVNERWVKAVIPRDGMLLRSYTHLSSATEDRPGKDNSDLGAYYIYRNGDLVTLSFADYEQKKRDKGIF